MKPDADRTLASLKDFQRATVDYVFHRLWLAEDQVKRFLVADEVGLGKTMVAKGVIAKTVEHLWDTDKRIDIVYICSNSQIARQNLSRLNVVGGSRGQARRPPHAPAKGDPEPARSAHQLCLLHPGNLIPGRQLGRRLPRAGAAVLDARDLLGLNRDRGGVLETVLRGQA